MFNYALLALAFPTGYLIGRGAEKCPPVIAVVIMFLVVGFSVPEFIQADYPQYLVAPSKTISGQEYILMGRIRSERKTDDSIMELPGSSIQLDKMGQWFRYSTNLILPAMTDTRSFLGFTNLIYSEADVRKRETLIKNIVDMNTILVLTPTEDIIQTAKQTLDETKPYHVRYLVSPEPLLGLEQQKFISFYGSTDTTYIYVVNE